MHRSSLPWAAVLLLLLPFAVEPANAGSLEVQVRDRDGRPLANRSLRLRALSPEDPSVSRYPRGWLGSSDREGRAVFDGLPDGSYAVLVQGSSNLLPPQLNPFLPSPVVTIRGREDRQLVVLELWPGTRVYLRLELPVQAYSGFTAVFAHRETGTTITQAFRWDIDTIERVLAPGIWDVSVTPRPGFLLIGMENGRIRVDGHSMTLDLEVFPATADLTWIYTAPCTLYGSVVAIGGKEPKVGIEATLLTPGPWIEAARRRGGSIFERVTASVDARTGDYEMMLPDGDWSVRPVGPLLVESTPELEVMTLDPGGTARADFTIRLAEGSDTFLPVQVLDPNGRRVKDALVAAFPIDDDEADPVSTATSDRSGRAHLAMLPRGDYLLVAGHSGFLEGRFELLDYEPDSPRDELTRIGLESGAAILFEVRDAEGRTVAGVDLEVERLGDPPPTRLADAELAVARGQRSARTDHSGRTRLRGFYPGRYRLRAERLGTTGRNTFVYLRHDRGELERVIEIELGAGESTEVEGRQLPAASFHADLACADAWPLPRAVSVRVIEAQTELPADPSGRAGPQAGVVLTFDDLILVGRHRDHLVAGPVVGGAYRLAVRPAGFDRWTWAFDTHDPRRSTEISVSLENHGAESQADLGVLEIECGPAIDLLLEIAGGTPFPDLPAIEVTARLLDTRRDEEIAAEPWSTVREGRIELRGLPAARARLDLTLEHPHFLPSTILDWEIPVELERGKLVEPILEIEALGGAIELIGTAPSATLAIALGPAGTRREAAVASGKALLPSLVPGTYEVLLYATASKAPIAAWDALEVQPGITLRLDSRRLAPTSEADSSTAKGYQINGEPAGRLADSSPIPSLRQAWSCCGQLLRDPYTGIMVLSFVSTFFSRQRHADLQYSRPSPENRRARAASRVR